VARILAVGVATLDIVCLLDSYPPEDAKLRANALMSGRGGNATNTLCILSQLGHRCAWAGTLASDSAADDVLADLRSHGVDSTACRTYRSGSTPTSYVWRSMDTGSRTIVHHRDLPEFESSDFASIDLSEMEWLHFEGRNVDEATLMMARAREARPDLPLSLEVEKFRPGIERLFGEADIIMFSRDYARHVGCEAPEALIDAIHAAWPSASITCTWGDRGAWGRTPGGRTFHVGAFPPEKVVDTLGAGDTFNAGIIDQLVNGRSLEDAVTHGCRLAGRKCGHEGLRLK